ncbi:MAG: peptide chain release factor N(5)-glutamine methyltransferase [Burkholderiaceae bacterium]|nr:peptide chain release factor N(5)-glutamine methyltransferase [Burkholderiaceae bacterium]
MSGSVATVEQALANARGKGLDRLASQLLLLHALGRQPDDRAWLIAHDTDVLTTAIEDRFKALCERRAAGEPLAYLTGRQAFYGLELQVDPRVLVPRPDTETLVDWALAVLECATQPAVLDLGTGSGAIALAIKHECPEARVSALDASPGALEVAAGNALRLALEVDFAAGCWLEGVSSQYDLIVSNPPYIAGGDPHLPALTHEPTQALVSGADGLNDIRSIIGAAPASLRPGGWLLLEHGYDQAASVRALLAGAGFTDVHSRRDLAGIERCSGGKWPGLG